MQEFSYKKQENGKKLRNTWLKKEIRIYLFAIQAINIYEIAFILEERSLHLPNLAIPKPIITADIK